MDAYAILDGGGVKGAALAGCLKAADDCGIRFNGYGGTSAGSIVALLASAGYTPQELKSIVTEEVEFTAFLDDGGKLLEQLKKVPDILESKTKFPFRLARHWGLLKGLRRDFGLYNADKLRIFLLNKLRNRFPTFQGQADVTFQNLRDQKCPPLKIMISDIGRGMPIVAPGDETTGSVLEAVRASMSYPFVFKPFPVGDRYLVDGGLCSNLPVFLFEEERKLDRLPVIAFDLVLAPNDTKRAWTFGSFCGNMLSTALEAGDHLMRRRMEGVYYIPVMVPQGIDTLDFNLDRPKREALWDRGYAQAADYFRKNLPQWRQTRNRVEQLQALHIEDRLVKPVLKAFADEVEHNTGAKETRVNVWLPTPSQTRIIVYQYGMDRSSDLGLELALDAGRTGYAWTTRLPVIASIKESDESTVNMTQEQKNMVPRERDGLCSVPIFSPQRVGGKKSEERELTGLLAIDTTTALKDTQWLAEKQGFLIDCAQRWADILGELIH